MQVIQQESMNAAGTLSTWQKFRSGICRGNKWGRASSQQNKRFLLGIEGGITCHYSRYHTSSLNRLVLFNAGHPPWVNECCRHPLNMRNILFRGLHPGPPAPNAGNIHYITWTSYTPSVGIKSMTAWLRVVRSTSWASQASGFSNFRMFLPSNHWVSTCFIPMFFSWNMRQFPSC